MAITAPRPGRAKGRPGKSVEQDQGRRIDEQFPPRECRICGRIQLASEMAWEAKTGKPSPNCKRCVNTRKRRAERNVDGLYGHREVEHAPDPEPAKHLGRWLAAVRANDVPFESAWPDCVAYVLLCIRDPNDAREWRCAFRETEAAWRRGWDRVEVTKLTSALLLDVPSTGRSLMGLADDGGA